MGSSFRVELEELEAVRAKLQALLQDHFQAPSSPLAPNTFHNNTASDIQQTAVAGGIKRAEAMSDAGSSNFGETNNGLDAAWKLNSANGQVQQAIYGLINEVNQKISDLHDRIQKTHQLYSTTESNLQLDMTQVQKDA
jgi:septation ring formation regulator EzrA